METSLWSAVRDYVAVHSWRAEQARTCAAVPMLEERSSLRVLYAKRCVQQRHLAGDH